jgi:hypothetical protein
VGGDEAEPSPTTTSTLSGQCPDGDGFLYEGITPAEIMHNPDPISGAPPLKNAWRVGNRRVDTLVSAEEDRFVVNRDYACQPLSYNREQGDQVLVPGAGFLKITKAPLGPDVVNSAQRRGALRFTSESAISGTLHIHLHDASVTLDDAG